MVEQKCPILAYFCCSTETAAKFIKRSTLCIGSQGCRSLLSTGGDNLQFYPNFNIGGDEPRPQFFSGKEIK